VLGTNGIRAGVGVNGKWFRDVSKGDLSFFEMKKIKTLK